VATVTEGPPNIDTILKAALALFDNGFCVIPDEYRTKRPDPQLKDWPRQRLTREQIKQTFSSKRYNIGVPWGPASDWRVDIDLDTEEAVRAAPFFFPTTYTYGRKKRPNSHLIFKCEGAENKQYVFNNDEAKNITLLEIRSSGTQSVVPPSIHPDNDQYCLAVPNYSIYTIGVNELIKGAERTVAAALFARCWDGNRHAKTLALTGALLNAGWQDKDVVMFVKAVVYTAQDEEANDRKRACTDTIERYHEGAENITGWPTVSEYFGDAVVKKVREWLCIKDGLQLDDSEGLQTAEAAPWDAPKPVQAELSAVPAFNADALLPEPLYTWVLDEAYRMAKMPDYIATAALAFLGSVIGTGCQQG